MTTHEHERDEAELLSALMDGELSGPEEARALERLQSDPALQRRWARYHAARAALTGGAGRLSADFAERVAAVRAGEPVVLAPRALRHGRRAWLRPVAGIAIAASVALLAIGGLSVLRLGGPDVAPVRVADRIGRDPALVDHDPHAIAPVGVATLDGVTDAERARLRQRLMLYLATHSEYAGAGEMPTVIPYGRLSGLNAGQ